MDDKVTNTKLGEIYIEAISKFVEGEKKHGQMYPSTDPRYLIEESIEELLDSINYLAFQILKLRDIQTKLRSRVQGP